jgi:hypothetical protein
MSKGKITAGVVAIVLLVVGSVWAFKSRSDPQVEKVRQLQAEAFKPGATPDQRRASFELVRKEMDQLSPEQRHAVREGMHQNFERQMDQRIADYFTLPPAQRVAQLDQQIKEMEKHAKDQASRGRQGGGAGGGGPGRGPANAGGGGPPRDNSATARAVRRNERLDRSTPEQRAQRSAYFSDLKKRRVELGLSPMPPHRH